MKNLALMEEKLICELLKQGQITPVIQHLRSDNPSPRVLRCLADLLSGNEIQDYCVIVKTRSGIHGKQTRRSRSLEDGFSMLIAATVMELIAQGRTPQQAFYESTQELRMSKQDAEEFNISEDEIKMNQFSAKTAERAYYRWRDVIEIREMC